MAYEKFAMYGVSVDYPEESEIEFRGAIRGSGEITFTIPEAVKAIVLWRPLNPVKKKAATPEGCCKEMLSKIGKTRGVLNVEVLEQKSFELNGHQAEHVYYEINAYQGGVFKKRTIKLRGMATHLFCEETERHFSINSVPTNNIEKQKETFNRITESFRCHQKV